MREQTSVNTIKRRLNGDESGRVKITLWSSLDLKSGVNPGMKNLASKSGGDND